MDWSLVLYAALGGGGGAGLGAILAAFTQKLRGKPASIDKNDKLGAGIGGGLAGGLAVLGMTVLPSLYKNMALPRIIPVNFSEVGEDMPIYKVIKEQSPNDYKRMIAPVDEAIRNNKLTQNTLNEMRIVLFKLFAEKTNYASADNLRKLEEQSIRQNQVYKEKKPIICTLIINGEPYPSVSDILSHEDSLAEQEAMIKLFTDPPRDPNIVPDSGNGKKLFDRIVSSSALDLDVSNLRPNISEDLVSDIQNSSLHKKICDLSMLISAKKIDLSDKDLIDVSVYLASFE